MGQNLRFGLILGWLAILKKRLGRRFFFFYVFMGKNISFIKEIADFETT